MRNYVLLATLWLITTACATPSNVFVDFASTEGEVYSPEFQWPVDGAIVTQKFRPKPQRYRRRHRGIDLAAEKDTPIYAVHHGVVVYAGHGFRGFGRLIIIDHLNGQYQSYYAHLSRYKVERGDVVKKGDLIGLMGNSGRSTGVHLHFEIRQGEVALNPLDFLPQATLTAQPAAP